MLPIKEPVVYNLVKQQMVGLEDMFSVTAWVKLPEYSEGILVRTHISKLLIEDAYISLDDILKDCTRLGNWESSQYTLTECLLSSKMLLLRFTSTDWGYKNQSN